MRKPTITLLVLICLAVLLPLNAVYAAEPQKIFIAPTVDYHGYGDAAVYRLIEQHLTANFNYPLNAIVHRYEIVPPTTAITALLQSVNSTKLKLSKETLRIAAQAANADFIIIPRLNRYSYWTYTTWDGELMQQTEINLECLAYEPNSDKFYRIKTNRSYHSDYSQQGEPEYLLNDMLDEIIMKLPYGRVAAAKS